MTTKPVSPLKDEIERRKRYFTRQLVTQTRNRTKTEEAADRERATQFALMLEAHENGGLTYAEIAAATELSEVRVSQILAEQRTARGDAPKPRKKRTPAKKAGGKGGPAVNAEPDTTGGGSGERTGEVPADGEGGAGGDGSPEPDAPGR